MLEGAECQCYHPWCGREAAGLVDLRQPREKRDTCIAVRHPALLLSEHSPRARGRFPLDHGVGRAVCRTPQAVETAEGS